MAGRRADSSPEELMEEAAQMVQEMEWVRARETRPPMAIMALAAPGRQQRPHLPIPYPRWGVRPEEQLVRFNSRIDPFHEIPAMPVQEMTAAATLVAMRGSPEAKAEELRLLAEAGEKERRREEEGMRFGAGTTILEMGSEINHHDHQEGALGSIGGDEEEWVVDSRYLRGDEVIHQGDEVHFVCHDVIVGKRLDR
jgi:hypothetical protein